MGKSRIPVDVLQRLVADRAATGVMMGTESSGRGAFLKLIVRGVGEVYFLPVPVALHIRTCLKDTLKRIGYVAPRSRRDVGAPFDKAETANRLVVEGCEVHSFADGVALALLIDAKSQTYKCVRADTAVCSELLDLLDGCAEDPLWVNLAAANPGSGARN
jgi:hypothetical protein